MKLIYNSKRKNLKDRKKENLIYKKKGENSK